MSQMLLYDVIIPKVLQEGNHFQGLPVKPLTIVSHRTHPQDEEAHSSERTPGKCQMGHLLNIHDSTLMGWHATIQ